MGWLNCCVVVNCHIGNSYNNMLLGMFGVTPNVIVLSSQKSGALIFFGRSYAVI